MKLLALLLGFGLLPFLASVVIGSALSRALIINQAAQAMQSLVDAQANHLATELARERLLLRTIAGRLPSPDDLGRTQPEELRPLLIQSLLGDGVFDGLRIVTSAGDLVASVALRNTAPHWPAAMPAADWEQASIVVHREGDRALAYLIAAPLGGGSPRYWIEGHVRAEDFRRAFAIPEHLVEGVESVVFETSGEPVFAPHDHAVAELATVVSRVIQRGHGVSQVEVGTGPALVATGSVPTTAWVFAATLPLEVALAPVARLRAAALFGSGVLVAVILVTGIIASRAVTTPLQSLALAVRDVGHGSLPRPIVARSEDEVGTLVRAVNAMGQDLERSRDEIESLHARDMERAQQLATVGELASGVAHEIRNPLTGVRGALELALRKLPPAEASRPLLEEAQEQLRRIEATTTRLLHYARPPELRDVLVDANLLVERAATVVAPKATKAQVAIQLEPAPTAVPVRVDPELLVQVLVNLMLNGIEAMGPEGRLTVWVTRHAPDIWIGVRDTGPGVPDTLRAEVFRPFFTTKHQGTGLGLSISRQIVTRHGGTLRLEETPDGGATFVVTLPLAEGERGGRP